mmetsp:Transcript_30027/g.51874  ORF Transcript_30027/g.51874 Transcript_30027/m.51874 type:complete len:104 (+) Transcript_30027:104-415(+)
MLLFTPTRTRGIQPRQSSAHGLGVSGGRNLRNSSINLNNFMRVEEWVLPSACHHQIKNARERPPPNLFFLLFSFCMCVLYYCNARRSANILYVDQHSPSTFIN